MILNMVTVKINCKMFLSMLIIGLRLKYAILTIILNILALKVNPIQEIAENTLGALTTSLGG